MFEINDKIKNLGAAVLLVDDDHLFLSLGQELLEHMGFQAWTAASGDEALGIFRLYHQQINLVIMDFNLPHIDAHQLLGDLKTIKPAVKVIVVSGYLEQDDIERFGRAGAAGMIHKPFRAQQLQEEIIQVLGD